MTRPDHEPHPTCHALPLTGGARPVAARRLLRPAALVSRNLGIRWCGREFDLIEYFSRNPLFAETFRRYRPVAEVEGYRPFLRED